ncbi:PAS domain S-box protein [Paenibacillus mesophilus]|nr:PAS domain S-box protein [Paenibacillus mesophilus]
MIMEEMRERHRVGEEWPMARKRNPDKENIALFDSAFRHAPIGMALVDIGGRFLKINDALSRIVGFGEEELLNRTFLDITHPDDIYTDVVYADQLLSGKLETYRLEKRYVHKEGHFVHTLLNASIMRDERGNPLYFISHIQEKPGCGLTEGELHDEEMYRLIAEKSQDIIAYCSADLRIRYVSPAVKRLLGYEAEEVIGLKCIHLQHPDDLQEAKKIIGDIDTLTCRFRHKDNHYVWFECTYRIIRDSSGKIENILSFSRDITERRQAEEKLALQEEQYRQLVEHSPDAVLIANMEKGLYMNESGVRLLGGSSEEDKRTILENPLRFIPVQYGEIGRLRNGLAAEGKTAEFFELELVRLDGQIIEAEARSVPTVFQNEPAVYTIIRDISERKRTLELLNNSEKLSVAGQLAAGIAHEIRNPLTAIRGFHQLMQKNGPKKEYFDILSSELSRIELILTELLVLAKPQQAKFANGDIVAIIYQVMALLETQAIMNNVRLLIRCTERSLFMMCDENQIKQVFINIIKNAIEAMPDGGDVIIEIKRAAERLLVRVSDRGGGIPQHLLPRIGQPFYTTKEEGTGLGLMITNNIIENHKGTMKIESRIGAGTTFTIELPI